MDIRERWSNDLEEVLRRIIDAKQLQMFTALPVIVHKDSDDGHTVHLQIAVKGHDEAEDGTVTEIEYPVLQDVPIQFSQGGGVTMTHPVKKGDEGFVIFSCRSQDNWHEKGGVQSTINSRAHDLSDGRYFPGGRSTPNKLKNYSKDSAQMRSDDGKHFVDLHPTKGTITVSVDGGKHSMTVDQTAGISHKSSVAVSIDAPTTTLKGKVHVAAADDGSGGTLTAAKGVQAPIINGVPGPLPGA
jgi:phage baseplate assembly protein gpV